MTNNIEKLYELAKVEKKIMCDWTCYSSLVCNSDCEHFNSQSLNYPPFTDTKQLELIKWLIEENKYISIITCPDGLFIIGGFSRKGINQDFSQALAGLVCELWEDLTDTQKEEIKRILE